MTQNDHISWFYGYYRLDLDETDAKIDALFCPQCVQMTGIFVFQHGRGGNFHFLDDMDYLLCNVGVSFRFYPIEVHFFQEGFSHFSKFRT